jgi:hypothetical protein
MYRSMFMIFVMLVLGLTSIGQTESSRPGATAQLSRQIRCYPNPATTAIFFEFKVRNALESTQLRIYNFLGKKVVDIPRLNANTRIDLQHFNRGIYIYQLTDAHGRVMESGKFYVEKP